MTATPSTRETRAMMALCHELCAQVGEPPCYRVAPDDWDDGTACDCKELAPAVAAFATAEQQRSDDVRAAAIEECAKVAEGWQSPLRPGAYARLLGHQEASRSIASAIRALAPDTPR